ncbi:hypothetical protein DMA11_10160 [Marinilabiliaceae bacterium JC017]|nr:hypothetical protein DMA11_10160 [Marinilabiliaceae bacterium JC017]
MSEHNDLLKDFNTLKEEPPFKVPEDYFASLPDKVEARLERETIPQKQKVIEMIKPWLTLAAIFFLIMLLFHTFGPKQINTDTRMNVADQTEWTFEPLLFELSDMDIMSYMAKENIPVETQLILGTDDAQNLDLEEIEELILF